MTQTNSEREKKLIQWVGMLGSTLIKFGGNLTIEGLTYKQFLAELAQSPISQNEQQEAVYQILQSPRHEWEEVSKHQYESYGNCGDEGKKRILFTSPPKQAIPEGWKLISDELPISGIRVLIFTDGVDFNGEQYFDVQSDSLNEFFYESRHDMPEVCIHATHWMPLPTPTLK